jgi:hypothetical protein
MQNDIAMYAHIASLRVLLLAVARQLPDRPALIGAIRAELDKVQEAFLPQSLPDSMLSDIERHVQMLVDDLQVAPGV